MIKLVFTFNRETIFFLIHDKKVMYFDRKWDKGVPFIPKDKDFIMTLIKSRNRIPMSQQILQWVNEANSGKNFEEYEACKDDDAVAEVVRREAKTKGLVELKDYIN